MSQLSIFETEQKKEYEYFLLVPPGVTISNMVRDRKNKLHHEIGLSRENLFSVPHVSFLKFRDFERNDLVLPLMKKAVRGMKEFKAEINKLEVFDHGSKKSLVLNFKDPEPFRELFSRLTNCFGINVGQINPHLTIARSISGTDFRRIQNINEYTIEGNFICNNIKLLRKELNTRQRYETIANLFFN